MAELKSTRIEYVFTFSQDEFNLMLRALGHAAGAKVKITPPEMELLRTVNLRLVKTRQSVLQQQLVAADGAVRRAEELSAAPLPPESVDDFDD